MAEIGVLFFLLFIAIAALVIAAKTIKIVPQATVMLIERLGRFSRVATAMKSRKKRTPNSAM